MDNLHSRGCNRHRMGSRHSRGCIRTLYRMGSRHMDSSRYLVGCWAGWPRQKLQRSCRRNYFFGLGRCCLLRMGNNRYRKDNSLLHMDSSRHCMGRLPTKLHRSVETTG